MFRFSTHAHPVVHIGGMYIKHSKHGFHFNWGLLIFRFFSSAGIIILLYTLSSVCTLQVRLSEEHLCVTILPLPMLIYLLTAIGSSSGGSTHLHTNST